MVRKAAVKCLQQESASLELTVSNFQAMQKFIMSLTLSKGHKS